MHKWILLLITTFLAGCFFAMPSSGPPGAGEYIGKTVVLNRDILVVSYFSTPISWEVQEEPDIGPNQKVISRLSAGTQLKIKAIKSFRMPIGIQYSYRCVSLENGLTFDLGFDMKDSFSLKNQ